MYSSVKMRVPSLTNWRIIGMRVEPFVSAVFNAMTLPFLCTMPKTGVFVLSERPCVPSVLWLSCLFLSRPPMYASSHSTSEVHGGEPLDKRQFGVLEYRANEDGKVVQAVRTSELSVRTRMAVVLSAIGADNVVSPTLFLEEALAHCVVLEVGYQ